MIRIMKLMADATKGKDDDGHRYKRKF